MCVLVRIAQLVEHPAETDQLTLLKDIARSNLANYFYYLVFYLFIYNSFLYFFIACFCFLLYVYFIFCNSFY